MGILLAIESSCDDTSVAIMKDRTLLSNITCTQDLHKKYGGVVPEVASRQHHKDIIPTVNQALENAGVGLRDIDAIAFTRGPGLLGSLIVGVSFAKGLALSLDIPLIDVHHMHAHILSHFAEPPYPAFPFLCLTVSGGHTQIVLVKGYDDMTILGSTIDDAAGEAFDKTGKMIGLHYPAGPEVDRLAQQGKPTIKFAKPSMKGYDYSFSGFKTSVLYTLRKYIERDDHFVKNNIHDICASIQISIVDILMEKFSLAIGQYKVNHIAIAGGVAANSELQKRVKNLAADKNLSLFIPKIEYCTDNAGMIAAAAWFKYEDKRFCDQSVVPDARLSF